MKLRDLKKLIDAAIEQSGDADPNVEVWFKKDMYRIREVAQFGISSDVTITIGEKALSIDDEG